VELDSTELVISKVKVTFCTFQSYHAGTQTCNSVGRMFIVKQAEHNWTS
jgi:hypothetical protein